MLIQNYADGGLQMVHIETYIKLLKSLWFRRILQSTNNLLNTHFGVYKTYIPTMITPEIYQKT